MEKVIGVMVRIRIVEAFAEAVDVDAWVRIFHIDGWVRSVMVTDRQENITRVRIINTWAAVSSLLFATIIAVAWKLVLNEVISNHRVDLNSAHEVSPSLDHAVEQNCDAHTNGGIDTVLNTAEDRNEDASKEYENFDWVNLPELVDSVWWCDQIPYSVNNNSREHCAWDVVENGWQGVDSEEDDNGGDHTRERCSHACLRLDGCSGKGSCCRVRTKEGAKQVCDTNGHHLLRRVNRVVVDTTKRLGDSNVLDQ